MSPYRVWCGRGLCHLCVLAGLWWARLAPLAPLQERGGQAHLRAGPHIESAEPLWNNSFGNKASFKSVLQKLNICLPQFFFAVFNYSRDKEKLGARFRRCLIIHLLPHTPSTIFDQRVRLIQIMLHGPLSAGKVLGLAWLCDHGWLCVFLLFFLTCLLFRAAYLK